MRYRIEGLECAHCAAKIEEEVRRQPPLAGASLSFATRRLTAPPGHEDLIQSILDRIEPGSRLVAEPADGRSTASSPRSHDLKQDHGHGSMVSQWSRPVLAAFFLAAGLLFRRPEVLPSLPALPYTLFVLSYLLVGVSVIRRALLKIRSGQMLDEHFLMSIASLGAFAIGEWPEAAAVMVFYAIGERLQSAAVNRSRRSIAALAALQPDKASLVTASGTQEVHPDEVPVGSTIQVRPGERIPLDGIVSDGFSFLDTSALTGESRPRRAAEGDEVLAGSINQSGLLHIRTTRSFERSSVARILALVEEAQERKAPAEQFITSFARYYTPAVVALAIFMAAIPPLLLPGQTFQPWLYRALILLVISCPCALVVSVPLTYFAGIGAASRHGVLFKGANYVDALARARTVVFDKTGTLTHGTFAITKMRPAPGIERDLLLGVAGAVEGNSNHPIAQSIRREAEGLIGTLREVSSFAEEAGQGVRATCDGREIMAGKAEWLEQAGISTLPVDDDGTAVHVAAGGVYLGHIVLGDELRGDALVAVETLRCLGIGRMFMLTGDRDSTAASISQALGLDGYRSELLPGGKVNALQEFGSEGVVFLGDGINDAPVISAASVGVAMGGIGSDAALEAADVVLVDPSPSRLAAAYALAGSTRRIARQNIVLSLGVKAVFLLLGAFGLATVWAAVFADVGVTLLAILNSLRAMLPASHRPWQRCLKPQTLLSGGDD